MLVLLPCPWASLSPCPPVPRAGGVLEAAGTLWWRAAPGSARAVQVRRVLRSSELLLLPRCLWDGAVGGGVKCSGCPCAMGHGQLGAGAARGSVHPAAPWGMLHSRAWVPVLAAMCSLAASRGVCSCWDLLPRRAPAVFAGETRTRPWRGVRGDAVPVLFWSHQSTIWGLGMQRGCDDCHLSFGN